MNDEHQLLRSLYLTPLATPVSRRSLRCAHFLADSARQTAYPLPKSIGSATRRSFVPVCHGLHKDVPFAHEVHRKPRTSPPNPTAPQRQDMIPVLRQAEIIVRLVVDLEVPFDIERRIAAIFTRSQGPIQVCRTGVRFPIPSSTSPAKWAILVEIVEMLRRENDWPDTEFVILLTRRPNELNWFSSGGTGPTRSSFIHADGWEWTTSVPLEHILAHNIVQGLLWRAAIEHRHRLPFQDTTPIPHGIAALTGVCHRQSRGCIFDFCPSKMDYLLKVRTADVCEDHLALLEEAGASPDLLRQVVGVLESCRDRALSLSRYHPHRSTYEHLPFPIAVTRHKAIQARDPMHRFLLLIDCFDALVRYHAVCLALSRGRPLDVPSRPSLGWWVAQLGETGEHEGVREAREIIESERICKLRNESRGHGYLSVDSSSYANQERMLEVTVERLTSILLPSVQQTLVLVREIKLESGRYRVAGHRLVGSNQLFPQLDLSLPNDSHPAAAGIIGTGVHLLDEANRTFRSLHPFIVEERCQICNHHRILISDGEQYIDPLVGHRTRIHTE